ncbi:MAG: VTT domain-containing protein [Phycisphaerales bacterium]|nr:VTT domain-containing protein [Phycisphaerales bacterium]
MPEPEPQPTKSTPDDDGAPKPPLLTRLGAAGPLAIAALALPPLSGVLLLTYMRTVSTWLQTHQSQGLVLYTVAFIVFAGLALLPTYAQAALGGFAFGVTLGIPAALVGFAGGAMLGYVIARRASGERVLEVLKERPKWMAVRDALVKDHESRSFLKSVGMVALLRCPPNSPFALTNLIMASVKVPAVPYFFGTLIGMAPRTVIAVVIGATVENFTRDDLDNAAPAWVWPVGIALSLAVFGTAAWIGHRAIEKMQRDHPPTPPAPSTPPAQNA